MSHDFTIAANRGELGGGELMLLELADAARGLGLRTRVVAPTSPGLLLEAARTAGHEVAAVAARDRPTYLRALRRWHAAHPGRLWCNGLLPAVATAGRRGRVVHLHQAPPGAQRLAAAVASVRADAVVVPSLDLGRRVRHDVVLPNWTDDLDLLPRRAAPGRRVVGFLGRVQSDKGVALLAEAVAQLVARGDDVELLVAGDDGFAGADDLAAVERSLAGLGDRVRRVGRVDRRDFFASVDLAVFPSVVAESFGLVVAEAMGFGVPFVVSDAGALAEVAGPGHPWVARAGDVADLADVVGAALAADPAATVAAARTRWQQEFSPAAGRRRFARLLRRVGYDVAVEVPR